MWFLIIFYKISFSTCKTFVSSCSFSILFSFSSNVSLAHSYLCSTFSSSMFSSKIWYLLLLLLSFSVLLLCFCIIKTCNWCILCEFCPSIFSFIFPCCFGVCYFAVAFNAASLMLYKLLMERFPISANVKIEFIPCHNAVSTSHGKE